MNDTPRYATLQDYLRVVRERRLLILVVMLLAVGIALFLSSRQEQRYEARARIALNDISQNGTFVGSSSSSQTIGQRLPLYASRVSNPNVLERTAASLGDGWNVGRVRSSVGAQVEASTGFITVTGSGRTGADAAAVANAVTTETVRFITDEYRKQLMKAARAVRRQLRSIPKSRSQSYLFAATQQRLFGLMSAAELAQPVSLNARAGVPGAPVAPRPVRDAILGGVFGLILGLVLAFLRDSLDLRLRRVDDLDREIGLPVVGRIRTDVMGRFVPHDESEGAALNAPAWEAFSMLRANLDFLQPGDGAKVVLVTSALPEEGKSTVAMHLAAASTMAGKRTLLVDLDLRRPVAATRAHLSPTPGLTDYLLDKAEPSAILRAVPLTGSSSNGRQPRTLTCIPAGTSTPWIAEILSSDRFADFITGVRSEYDLIVLDSPPLLAVADPLELVPYADIVLLCVKLGATRRNQAIAARDALVRAPQRPLGLVATGVKPSTEGDYAQYGYAYYSASPNGATSAQPSEALQR